MRWSFITDGNYINFRHTDETDLHIQQTIHRLHNTSRCIDWSLPADITRITFTIDESKYENISIYDVDFDGVVMSVQSDFETNITAMFTGLAGGGSSSYLVYTALLTQSGTDAPVVTVLNSADSNYLGDIVWTREGVGNYRGTLSETFTLNKTVAIPFGDIEANFNLIGIGYSLPFDYGYGITHPSVNYIELNVYKTSTYNNHELSDLQSPTQKIFVEIRVYP